MLIDLKTSVTNKPMTVYITIINRIPTNITSPCQLECELIIQDFTTHYLLTLTTKGKLELICQRCLHSFLHNYSNKTTLAICDSNSLADQLMSDYEYIVAVNNQIDLVEIVTDELYLYAPTSHPNTDDCSKDIDRLISIVHN